MITLFRPALRRFIVSPARSRLIRQIENQIQYQYDQYKIDQNVGPFLDSHGFDIQDIVGYSSIILRKIVNKQKVQVTFSARPNMNLTQNQENDEEEIMQSSELKIHRNYAKFQVSVNSPSSDQALVFQCASVDGEFKINNILHTQRLQELQRSSDLAQTHQYRGPPFTSLDERLQNEFRGYLKDFGIDEEVGLFVQNYSLDKEQRLYMEWLGNLKEFLNQNGNREKKGQKQSFW